jgi:hypothetical protein
MPLQPEALVGSELPKTLTEPDLAGVQEGLIVRPGDKLLIRVDPAAIWNATRVEELAGQLRERFPGVEVTVVAAEQLAVVRDG